jgi:hypothetical protein
MEKWVVILRKKNVVPGLTAAVFYCQEVDASDEAAALADAKRRESLVSFDILDAFPKKFAVEHGWPATGRVERELFDRITPKLRELWKLLKPVPIADKPKKPAPQLPPEVWNDRPFDPAVAWAATRIAAGDPERD